MCSIDLPEVADLHDLGPRELAAALVGLDRARRQVEALIGEAVAVAERTVAYAEDGHASVTGFVKATCNCSGGEAKAMVQCSRLLTAVPEVRAAAHAGVLGVAQTRLLARVFANPRSATQFPASAGLLVGHATELWFDEFAVVVRRWETLADVDGAHRAHERAHIGRDAHVSMVDEHVYLDARGGVPAGAVIEEIFERFCDLEFRTDWDTGVTQWGERMHPGLLDRTAAQRRFDALLAVFLAAAGSRVVGQVDPLVNIIADHPRPPPRPHDRQRSRTVGPQNRGPASLRNQSRLPARP